MTPVLVVSDHPLAVQPADAFARAGLGLSHLTLMEMETEREAIQKAAVIIWNVRDNFEACLQKITARDSTAQDLTAQDLTVQHFSVTPPSPPVAHIWLGKLKRELRLRALAGGVLYNHAGAIDMELALMVKNIARLLPAPNLNLRQGDPQGDWLLDMSRWQLCTPLGHDVQLQRAEAVILARLFEQAGVQQSRETLASAFKSDPLDKNRSLDVAISKIRKKVRDVADLGFPLRAIRGVGYVFVGNARVICEFPVPVTQPVPQAVAEPQLMAVR